MSVTRLKAFRKRVSLKTLYRIRSPSRTQGFKPSTTPTQKRKNQTLSFYLYFSSPQNDVVGSYVSVYMINRPIRISDIFSFWNSPLFLQFRTPRFQFQSSMGANISGIDADTDGDNNPPSRPKLGDIPESCLALVLMNLDPPEICKLARLNRAFRGASAADFIWEAKLPPNYRSLIQELKIFDEFSMNLRKKGIYARLCRPNPFDGGTKVPLPRFVLILGFLFFSNSVFSVF